MCIVEKRAIHYPELSNPLLENEQPIPDSKPDSNTDNRVFTQSLPRGAYGYVKLTDEEYRRLTADLGQTEAQRVIAYVDESAAMTGNKNKWRNWNLVLRKASREKWGVREKQSPEGRMIELDEQGRLIT